MQQIVERPVSRNRGTLAGAAAFLTPASSATGRMWLLGLLGCIFVGSGFMGSIAFLTEWPGRDDYAFIYHACVAMRAGIGGAYATLDNVYPPATMAIFYPLAFLGWFHASAIVAVLSLLAFLIGIGFLVSVIPPGDHGLKRILFLCMSLLWAPSLAGFHSNNVSIIAISLVFVAITYSPEKRGWILPIILGLSVAMKPQLGAACILFWLLRGRWRYAAVSIGIVALINSLAILWIAHVEPSWLSDYKHSQIIFNTEGHWGDVSYLDTKRFVLLNIQVALYPFVKSASLSRLLGVGVGAVLFGFWLWIDRSARHRRNDFLAISSLLPITLIVVFQQYYNAALLLLCLAAVFTLKSSWLSRATAVLLAIYILRPAPLYALLPPQYFNGDVHSLIWNSFGIGFSAWLTLSVSVAMLALYWRWASGKEEVSSPTLFQEPHHAGKVIELPRFAKSGTAQANKSRA